MQELIKTMLTPTWVVSTLVAGLVINIVSGYVKDGMDKVLAVSSKRARESGSRRAQARTALAAKLHADLAFRLQYRRKRLLDAYYATWTTVLGLIMLLVGLADTSHVTGGSPPQPTARLFNIILGLVLLTVGGGYMVAVFHRSFRLLDAEGYAEQAARREAAVNG